MNAKINQKVRKSKHYNEKIHCKPTLFKIPLLLIRNLQQKRTYKHWQLKISIYSFLKYFRDSKITESDLLKRLPVFFENNFQTSRKSAVIQSVEYLIQEGFLMRDAQFIHIINYKNIVKEHYIQNDLPNGKKFLFKFKTNFFTFSSKPEFLRQFKQIFKSVDILYTTQLQLLNVLNRPKKNIKNNPDDVALQANAEIGMLSSEFLNGKGFYQHSASLMINALNLGITENHLYEIFAKGYADGSIEKVETIKIIACSQEFKNQANKNSFFSDFTSAIIIDNQQELLRFSHEMENKKSNSELDYAYFSLYGKNKSVRAICQVAAFYRKFNNISNQQVSVKLTKDQKEKIVKREIIISKHYENYCEVKPIQISPSLFTEKQKQIWLDVNTRYEEFLKQKEILKLSNEKKLSILEDSFNTFKSIELCFKNKNQFQDFKKIVHEKHAPISLKEKKKTYFQQLRTLGIYCNISEIVIQGKGGLDCSDKTKIIKDCNSSDGKDMFLAILKTTDIIESDKIIIYNRLINQEKRICKKLGLKIGEKNLNELFLLNKLSFSKLSDSQQYMIEKLKNDKINCFFNSLLTNVSCKITTIA